MVYVVTSGDYSDYHIEGVFENKEKAELYCGCHEDCEIEEYGFMDDNIYTPFDAVRIQCNYRNGKVDKVYTNFVVRAEEDETYMKNNKSYINIYGNDWVDLVVIRRLQRNYDKNSIINKYTKVCEDIFAEIKYMLTESGYSKNMEYKDRRNIEENINTAINSKIQ